MFRLSREGDRGHGRRNEAGDRRVADPDEMAKVGSLMLHKFPQVAQFAAAGMEDISLFRVSPEIVSILDYRKGFGHTETAMV